MKLRTLLLGAFAAAAIGAPASAGVIFDETSGLNLEATGTAFMNGLYEGYVELSKERDGNMDVLDAEYFNHKARRAARRASTMPDAVMDRILTEDDQAAFTAALKRLRTVYDRGARHMAPIDSAQAQVSYDCWIEAAEGTIAGWASNRSGRAADVERCKADFEAAIAKAEAVANLHLTGAPPPKAPMAAPAQAMAAPDPFIIYFAWDSAALDSTGRGIIDDAVASANRLGIVDFTITGHADRSGPDSYNLDLSLRRANSVRTELIARGVKAGGISVAGRGEAEPAVATADGVREPANRRVEIILL